MAAYKPDQGRMVRMAVFWSLAVLVFYGCRSLRSELSGWLPSLKTPLSAAFEQVPVLQIPLTGAFLISAAVFALTLFLAHRWLESPKIADLLIDTETELRKVTWPSGQEVLNSSIVVVVCVVVLMAFLAGADWFLARLVNPILF